VVLVCPSRLEARGAFPPPFFESFLFFSFLGFCYLFFLFFFFVFVFFFSFPVFFVPLKSLGVFAVSLLCVVMDGPPAESGCSAHAWVLGFLR